MIYLKCFILAAFLFAINITDIKYYKIKNSSVAPVVAAGLILGIINQAFADSCYGMLFPLVLFPLFCLKMLGAGDIKALCAVGALFGLETGIYSVAFSLISGGVIALIFMVINRNFAERFRYFFTYLKLCWLTRSIEKYNFGDKNKSIFRFSYAITCGSIAAIVRLFL